MLEKLIPSLQPVATLAKKYAVIILALLFGGMCAYLLYTSNRLMAEEPTDKAVSDSYAGAKRPKIEESVINRINQLRDENIQFQTLIDEARKNPFAE